MTGCYKIDKFSRRMKSTLAAPPRHKVNSSNISSFIPSRMNDVEANDFVVLMLESVALSCFLRISTEVANYTHLALSM
jgi:hypothetical protein